MTTKSSISKTLANELKLSKKECDDLVNEFVSIITNESKIKILKISKFGTFYTHKTKERIGRNPKTKESYIICSRNKLVFKPSQKIKEKIN